MIQGRSLLTAAVAALLLTLGWATGASAGVELEHAWRTDEVNLVGSMATMAVGPDGRIYQLNDWEPSAVDVYDQAGRRTGGWKLNLRDPELIAIEPSGTVAVLANGRIHRYTAEGRKQRAWRVPRDGKGDPVPVTNMVPDPRGGLVLLGVNRVRRLDGDGREIPGFRIPVPNRHNGLRYLSDAVVEPDGSMLAVYPGGARVARFDSSGRRVARFGRSGFGPADFKLPVGIDRSPGGNIAIYDAFLNRVQVFDSEWKLLEQWGSAGSGPGRFDYPAAMAFAAEDRLVVTTENRFERTQVFALDDGPSAPQAQLVFQPARAIPAVPGHRSTVRLRIRNFGDAPARGVKLCPGGWGEETEEVMRGVRCRRLAPIPPGREIKPRFRVNAPEDHRGSEPVFFDLTSRNAGNGPVLGILGPPKRRR